VEQRISIVTLGVADVSRAADCEGLVNAVVAQWGGVDILLNNAGTSAAAAFEKVDDETWQADWDLKVMGAVRMSRLVIPHMKKRGGGRIVNITSSAGLHFGFSDVNQPA